MRARFPCWRSFSSASAAASPGRARCASIRSPWTGGSTKGLYTSGAVGNIKDFHAAVTGGPALADTVGPSVESNLAAILGRMAATSGREVTWDEMITAAAKIDPKLQLPKDGPTSTM